MRASCHTSLDLSVHPSVSKSVTISLFGLLKALLISYRLFIVCSFVHPPFFPTVVVVAETVSVVRRTATVEICATVEAMEGATGEVLHEFGILE